MHQQPMHVPSDMHQPPELILVLLCAAALSRDCRLEAAARKAPDAAGLRVKAGALRRIQVDRHVLARLDPKPRAPLHRFVRLRG